VVCLTGEMLSCQPRAFCACKHRRLYWPRDESRRCDRGVSDLTAWIKIASRSGPRSPLPNYDIASPGAQHRHAVGQHEERLSNRGECIVRDHQQLLVPERSAIWPDSIFVKLAIASAKPSMMPSAAADMRGLRADYAAVGTAHVAFGMYRIRASHDWERCPDVPHHDEVAQSRPIV
jgi:hypothetical protein